MASQRHNAVNNTSVSSWKSTNQAPGSATAIAPATGSVCCRSLGPVSGHGAQENVRSVARINTTNMVAPMGNASEPVVNGKTKIQRLENTTQGAHIIAFLADIALLKSQTKTFGDEMEQSELSIESAELTMDAFEKALGAFEAGIDLFNARMKTFEALESDT